MRAVRLLRRTGRTHERAFALLRRGLGARNLFRRNALRVFRTTIPSSPRKPCKFFNHGFPGFPGWEERNAFHLISSVLSEHHRAGVGAAVEFQGGEAGVEACGEREEGRRLTTNFTDSFLSFPSVASVPSVVNSFGLRLGCAVCFVV